MVEIDLFPQYCPAFPSSRRYTAFEVPPLHIFPHSILVCSIGSHFDVLYVCNCTNCCCCRCVESGAHFDVFLCVSHVVVEMPSSDKKFRFSSKLSFSQNQKNRMFSPIPQSLVQSPEDRLFDICCHLTCNGRSDSREANAQCEWSALEACLARFVGLSYFEERPPMDSFFMFELLEYEHNPSIQNCITRISQNIQTLKRYHQHQTTTGPCDL